MYYFAKLGLICLKDCQIKLLRKPPQVESLLKPYVACALRTISMMVISHFQSFSRYLPWQEEPDQNSERSAIHAASKAKG